MLEMWQRVGFCSGFLDMTLFRPVDSALSSPRALDVDSECIQPKQAGNAGSVTVRMPGAKSQSVPICMHFVYPTYQSRLLETYRRKSARFTFQSFS